MYKLLQCNSILLQLARKKYIVNFPMIFCSLHKLSYAYPPTQRCLEGVCILEQSGVHVLIQVLFTTFYITNYSQWGLCISKFLCRHIMYSSHAQLASDCRQLF